MIKKLTKKEIEKGNKLIAEFIGFDWKNEILHFVNDEGEFLHSDQRKMKVTDLEYHSSWDWLIPVAEKIESLGAHFQIKKHNCGIFWWYSSRKTVTFQKGAGGGGGGTESRNPFDSIGGKHFSKHFGVDTKAERINFKTKIEAFYYSVLYFVEWYDKNVKKK